MQPATGMCIAHACNRLVYTAKVSTQYASLHLSSLIYLHGQPAQESLVLSALRHTVWHMPMLCNYLPFSAAAEVVVRLYADHNACVS